MKLMQRNKKRAARGVAAAMCFSLLITSGQPTVIKAKGTDSGGKTATLGNPVIEAGNGHVVWDCIYFGNYWQKKYIPQSGNMPETGEDDAVHTDDDGTRYIVRKDKNCYKYEPVKWRVLSVSEDGTDAFVMADKTLDGKAFHSTFSETVTKETVTWENSDVRQWLNGTFMSAAFSEQEQSAIKTVQIDNLSYSSYYGGHLKDGTPTEDRIFLPSLDDMVNKKYGFVNNFNPSDDPIDKGFSDTQTRQADNTDFAGWGEDGYKTGGYLLRTLGASEGYVFCTAGGEISITQLFGTAVDDPGHGVRPVLHLDLTKTDVWSYAGQVKQDKAEIAPDATPAAPTQAPTAQPGVTMAPGQEYPRNPVVHKDDLKKNTWDCIYFGKYYNTKFVPSVLSEAGQHDTIQTDKDGEYLVRREEGYFRYEPLKWRVLSISEDGTDAFVMADQVVDVAQYYRMGDVEMTWEKSDIRKWLAEKFMPAAFTGGEQEKILDSQVSTLDNKWSGEPGGNDTTDKIYLLSIEEAMEPSYGFSSDENEGDTRRISVTGYAKAEEQMDWIYSDAGAYWLRSAGSKKGCPAVIGSFGEGEIRTENSNVLTEKLGVRPVMHVDLSDTSLWAYAGQVTPEGVVVPKEDPSAAVSPQPKKPGKPVIKKLKNSKGGKVTVTLSKKVSGATGYQAAYAADSSMKGQKIKSFKGTSVTVKSLEKKKTYYFRVRAYTEKNGQTVYGSWGNTKKIKIKK